MVDTGGVVPVVYSGRMFPVKGGVYMNKPTEIELTDALEKAISVYQYASMTSWERECCEEDMKFAEDVFKRTGRELE